MPKTAYILVLLLPTILANSVTSQIDDILTNLRNSNHSMEDYCKDKVLEDLTLCSAASQCLTFLKTSVSSLNITQLDKQSFPVICSLFLKDQNLSEDINIAEEHRNDDIAKGNARKPTQAEVWGYSLLCVTLISLTSILGVGVLPLMSKTFYSKLLTSLIGLAVGSLAGSAIFHLIPSAFNLAAVSFFPHHSYLTVAFAIFAGMYLFFIIERCLKIFMDAKARMEGEEIFGHNHNNQTNFVGVDVGEDEKLVKNLENGSSITSSNTTTSLVYACNKNKPDCKFRDENFDIEDMPQVTCESSPSEKAVGFRPLSARKRCCSETITEQEKSAVEVMERNKVYQTTRSAIKASFGHLDKPHPETRPTVESVKKLEEGRSKIATVAWMIIFGDGLHNFVDGLSIGAAFSTSILTGISVSIAVLCEEFPHELGDFAVLLNAGMTVKQAMMYNFLSACTCYCGLVLGILLGELDANTYIFAIAGGMFLYIALVDMIPELNETVEIASKESVGKALWIFFLQNIGILIGICFLFTLAKFQDEIDFTAV